MKILTLTFCLTVLFATYGLATQSGLEITADRLNIEAGENTTLTWNSTGDSAFLMGYGAVSASGHLSVSPEVTTEYVLVTESNHGISSASVKIEVAGAKGSYLFPDVEEFGTSGITGQQTNIMLPDFLDVIFKMLQDKLKFVVRGDFLPHRDYYYLYTDRRVMDDLLTKSDVGIRHRRIAYAVRVYEPSKTTVPDHEKLDNVRFEVMTLIDYQRAGESKWRPETNTDIKRAAAEQLKIQLAAPRTHSK